MAPVKDGWWENALREDCKEYLPTLLARDPYCDQHGEFIVDPVHVINSERL